MATVQGGTPSVKSLLATGRRVSMPSDRVSTTIARPTSDQSALTRPNKKCGRKALDNVIREHNWSRH